MKASMKRNHLEKEGQMEEDKSAMEQRDNGQETKKPKKNRFLGYLRNPGTWMRKTSDKEKRSLSELPGPSNIHLMDDQGRTSCNYQGQGKAKKRPGVLAHLQTPWKWLAGLKQRGSYILNEETPHISPVTAHKASAHEAKKCPRVSSVKLQAPWKWLADLKWRGSYVVREEIPPPGTSKEQEKDDEGDHTILQPGTSSKTVPLSLQCFTLHGILGQGGFGKVFLGRDIIRKEHVAIKETKKKWFTKYGHPFIERHVLQLSHQCPYLIHGLAAFQSLRSVYYVMEVATGGDLHDFILRYSPLDVRTAKFITAEVVCGVQFLHSQYIVHRDLKPGNILLTEDGHIKITDFGLAARYVFRKTTGTPGYAAPELVLNKPHGRGVDYYSIGVILYKLLTKRFPRFMRKGVYYPWFLTPDSVNIIGGLLCEDQSQRLGVSYNIRTHQFFSDINWKDVEARRMRPPACMTAGPVIGYPDAEEPGHLVEEPVEIKAKTHKIFNDFSFVCPAWSVDYHPVIIQTEDNHKDKRLFRPFWKKET